VTALRHWVNLAATAATPTGDDPVLWAEYQKLPVVKSFQATMEPKAPTITVRSTGGGTPRRSCHFYRRC